MSRADKLALLLTLLAFLAGLYVSFGIFENMAHIEDEMALVWQARVMADGDLTLPSPEHPKSFMLPFVVDYNGQRFGKYPLGWPALLSIGVRLGFRGTVNPLLGALAVWLTYLLGKRLADENTALLAAALTVTSPFFLINTGSLLSHPLGLVLSASFVLLWLNNLDGKSLPRWGLSLLTGTVLGVLFLTRPYTAAAISLPFALHSIFLLITGTPTQRRQIITLGAVTILIGSLHFAWQWVASGDPFKNLYSLYWEYDKVGFGPEYGRYGHSLSLAWLNTRTSLLSGAYDLFGWWSLSYLFLPFGLWAQRKKRSTWLVFAIFPALILLYAAYWIGAALYGPRYYYESLFALTIPTSAGIIWLGGWNSGGQWIKLRKWGVGVVLTILLTANLFGYLPQRLGSMRGLYGINHQMLAPFLSEEFEELTPALVIVHPDKWWTAYGGLLELQDPHLEGPLLLAVTRNWQNDEALAESYADSDRAVYHYYPDEPGVFYTGLRPEP